MKQFFKYALPGFLFLGAIVACEKEYESIDVIDERNVKAYIQQNKLNVTEYQDSGIFFEVLNPGSGPDMEYSEQVPVILTIKSLDGKYASLDTFSTANRYYNFLGYFNPEGVRIGLKEVLKKKSGSIRMLIPSRLAFGRNGLGDIPGNASLDITARVLSPSKIADYEDFGIKEYMAKNALSGFTRTSKGIYYKIADSGTGSPITIDSTITVEYTGKYLNGKVFDKTNTGSTVTLALSGFIDGWQQIIPLIKQGGSVQILVPSSSAYGLAGDSSRGMPPFMSLDFIVKVTDVSP